MYIVLQIYLTNEKLSLCVTNISVLITNATQTHSIYKFLCF